MINKGAVEVNGYSKDWLIKFVISICYQIQFSAIIVWILMAITKIINIALWTKGL
jgi:hypothetical protein